MAGGVKPDSHEGSSGDADPGTDGNVGERKECSFRNELWLLGAGAGGTALSLSGTLRDPVQKGRCCMSQLSSGRKFEPIDVDIYLLFGISGNKHEFGTVASASPCRPSLL